MSLKKFVGKATTVDVPFMGGTIKVKRLSVGDTLDLQKKAREARGDDEAAEKAQIDLIIKVVKSCAEGGDELTEEEILTFPLEELNRIATVALGQETSEGNASKTPK
jgi:hypothetical protein